MALSLQGRRVGANGEHQEGATALAHRPRPKLDPKPRLCAQPGGLAHQDQGVVIGVVTRGDEEKRRPV
jgi:hypothetical protein